MLQWHERALLSRIQQTHLGTLVDEMGSELDPDEPGEPRTIASSPKDRVKTLIGWRKGNQDAAAAAAAQPTDFDGNPTYPSYSGASACSRAQNTDHRGRGGGGSFPRAGPREQHRRETIL